MLPEALHDGDGKTLRVRDGDGDGEAPAATCDGDGEALRVGVGVGEYPPTAHAPVQAGHAELSTGNMTSFVSMVFVALFQP